MTLYIKNFLSVAILFVILLSGCDVYSNVSEDKMDFSEYKPLPPNDHIKIIGEEPE